MYTLRGRLLVSAKAFLVHEGIFCDVFKVYFPLKKKMEVKIMCGMLAEVSDFPTVPTFYQLFWSVV